MNRLCSFQRLYRRGGTIYCFSVALWSDSDASGVHDCSQLTLCGHSLIHSCHKWRFQNLLVLFTGRTVPELTNDFIMTREVNVSREYGRKIANHPKHVAPSFAAQQHLDLHALWIITEKTVKVAKLKPECKHRWTKGDEIDRGQTYMA